MFGQRIARNQIEFSRIFGTLEMHPIKATTSEEYPELFELVNGDDKDELVMASYHGEKIVGRLDWHVDLQYTGRPNHGAVLTAVEVAAEDGLRFSVANAFFRSLGVGAYLGWLVILAMMCVMGTTMRRNLAPAAFLIQALAS